MKIVVVGCGKIGSAVVSSLVAEGHEVLAIDRDSAALGEIADVYDIMTVCGNGTDCTVLEEAGVAQTELFVAVTGNDNTNMLSCFLARKLGAAHTIARIRDPEYNDRSLSFIRHQLDLSMAVNPEYSAAQELYKLLKLPSAVKVETFSGRSFEMVELFVKPDSPLCGVRLCDLREKYSVQFLIGVVQRGDEVYIPDGNFTLQSGDRIGLTAKASELSRLLREMGLLQKQARRVMILGGSRTALYLARLLLAGTTAVKIIEKDPVVCQELCEALPKASVICGDGQQELLMEESLDEQDAFVALTGMDEQNILISLFAASQNVPKTVAKVNRDELAALAQHLGLESIISPKRTVVDILVRYARALENSRGSVVEKLYKLMDDRAEALEFLAGAESSVIGVPLRQLHFKSNVRIAGILRERVPFIPSGDDCIQVGDHVVILTTARLQDLSEILR